MISSRECQVLLTLSQDDHKGRHEMILNKAETEELVNKLTAVLNDENLGPRGFRLV